MLKTRPLETGVGVLPSCGLFPSGIDVEVLDDRVGEPENDEEGYEAPGDDEQRRCHWMEFAFAGLARTPIHSLLGLSCAEAEGLWD